MAEPRWYKPMNSTLVIIDCQEGLLRRIAEPERQNAIDVILAEIESAKEAGIGIILAEYTLRNTGRDIGRTIEPITAALEGYSHTLCFDHSNKALGEEVLAITTQQDFDRSLIRLCGVYRLGSVEETAKQISYCTNFQVKVEVIEAGCIGFQRLVSE